MVGIITDAGASLTDRELSLHGIKMVPHYIQMGKKCWHSSDISTEDILFWIEQTGEMPTITYATQVDWKKAFREALTKHDEIISFHSSSKTRDSYTMACLAAEQLDMQHRIRIVDTKTTSYSLGSIALRAAVLSDRGENTDSILYKTKDMAKHQFSQYYISRLDYLKKSGYLGSLAVLASSILNMRPIITVKDGEIIPSTQVLGTQNAITTILQSLKKYLESLDRRAKVTFVCSAGTEEQAKILRNHTKNFGMYEYKDNGIHLNSTIELAMTGPSMIGLVAEPIYAD